MGLEIEYLEQLKAAVDSIRSVAEALQIDTFNRLKVNAALVNFAARIDDTTTLKITYVGLADPSASVSETSAIWRIIRIDETGSVTKVEYADGDLNFDNKWSDRTSLTYS